MIEKPIKQQQAQSSSLTEINDIEAWLDDPEEFVVPEDEMEIEDLEPDAAKNLEETSHHNPSTEFSEPNSVSTEKVAKFKEFGNGKGAMVFGDAAVIAAQAIEVETLSAKNGSPYLKLTQEQIPIVTLALQEQGWQVNQKNAQVTLHGQSASVRGDAAVAIAHQFEFDLGATQKGVPKVKFDQGKLQDVITFLKDQKFVVSVQEVEPSPNQKPPTVMFRGDLESEQFQVFDASAKTLAQKTGRPLNQTSGGRPMMTVSREDYKQFKSDFKGEIDLKLSDLPKATISLYAEGRGASVIGPAAIEVAATLGLKTEPVTRKSDGATFPRVQLAPGQIKSAKAALEGQFNIEERQLPPLQKAALIKLDKEKEEIIIVGDAAPVLAKIKGIEPKISQKGSPYLRLGGSELEQIKTLLNTAGFDKFDMSETKPASQKIQDTFSSKSQVKPKQKVALEMD